MKQFDLTPFQLDSKQASLFNAMIALHDEVAELNDVSGLMNDLIPNSNSAGHYSGSASLKQLTLDEMYQSAGLKVQSAYSAWVQAPNANVAACG